MLKFVRLLIITNFVFILGCSGFNDDSQTVTVRRTINQQESIQAGQQHLTGSAQTDYQSDAGSFRMNSTADDNHYKDSTIFDGKGQRNNESWGK